jgi:hypothetical protein
MKITKQRLKEIIKEELSSINENNLAVSSSGVWYVGTPDRTFPVEKLPNEKFNKDVVLGRAKLGAIEANGQINIYDGIPDDTTIPVYQSHPPLAAR